VTDGKCLVRVLVSHNHYQQPGGEDQVFRAEVQLLREHGHAVLEYSEHNDAIVGRNRLRLAVETIWSERSRSKLAQVLAEFRPDIAHFHNIFPLISPSAYYVCRDARVPVVQTLHNYRLGCAKATYYRDGRPCHECRGKLVGWSGVVHACYRDSRATTAPIVVMNAAHRLLRTWTNQVDAYIALSHFARASFIAAGLPASKIAVKGNFVGRDPGIGGHRAGYVLFVGRLTAEKGVTTLLQAWRQLSVPLRLKVVGDGPLADQVAEAARTVPGIEWLGPQPPHAVLNLMGDSMALVFPSEWDEPFGLVAIEAFAKGTPVIAAAAGAIPEIVEHGRTGLLYSPGAPDQLAMWAGWSTRHPDELTSMGQQARRSYETRYTAEHNYEKLMAIYRPLVPSSE
jgi:glycosyltransferase involved in cell wall biosynthesis